MRYFIWSLLLQVVAQPLIALAAINPTQNYTVVNNVTASYDDAYAIDTDGTYMYVGGYDNGPGGSDYQWRLEKRNLSDGSLVYATTSNPGPADDYLQELDHYDGYVYGIGWAVTSSNYYWYYEKRSALDGSLAYATTSGGANSWANTIVASGSYLYAGGGDFTPGNRQWRLEKRNLSDGSLVYATTSNPSTGSSEEILSITLDDSYVYLAGMDRSPGNLQWRIEKRNISDGALVASTTNNLNAGHDYPYEIVLNDGSLYVGGYSASSSGQWHIEKRSASDLSLVTSTSSDFGGTDYITGMSVSGDSLVVSGLAADALRIERRSLSDLSLLAYATEDPSSGSDFWGDLAIYGTDAYLAGYDASTYTTDAWLISSYNLAPAPTVSSFSPSSDTIKAGSEAQTLTINGTNFSASTTALTWKGSAKTATFVSSTQMTVNFSTSDLEADGRFTLTIPNDNSAADDESFTYDIAHGAANSGSGGRSRSSSPDDEDEPSQNKFATKSLFLKGPATPPFSFLKNLKYLQVDPDVKELQKFLNKSGFPVSLEGPGSAGNETDFFGALTKAALIRFQEANADAILKPNNLTKGTGYFGPSTRAVVNEMLE